MIKVTTFYKFFPIVKKDLSVFRRILWEKGEGKIRGLLRLAAEGVNGTLCGPSSDLESYKRVLDSVFPDKDFFYKDSFCDEWNFRRLSVKIKKEIVTIGRKLPVPPDSGKALEPEEWEQEFLQNPQVLDVRNTYEVELGKFKQARHLNLQHFRDFPQKLKQSGLNKKKKTLIYCTGGIRCEKALKVMQEEGFRDVFQLHGGVLNYLKSRPDSSFEKECFVFDHRVTLNQQLTPGSQYRLCPHCGQPGDKVILCAHCRKGSVVCRLCLKKAPEMKTCSKNCAYHLEAGHRFKKHKKKGVFPYLTG